VESSKRKKIKISDKSKLNLRFFLRCLSIVLPIIFTVILGYIFFDEIRHQMNPNPIIIIVMVNIFTCLWFRLLAKARLNFGSEKKAFDFLFKNKHLLSTLTLAIIFGFTLLTQYEDIVRKGIGELAPTFVVALIVFVMIEAKVVNTDLTNIYQSISTANKELGKALYSIKKAEGNIDESGSEIVTNVNNSIKTLQSTINQLGSEMVTNVDNSMKALQSTQEIISSLVENKIPVEFSTMDIKT